MEGICCQEHEHTAADRPAGIRASSNWPKSKRFALGVSPEQRPSGAVAPPLGITSRDGRERGIDDSNDRSPEASRTTSVPDGSLIELGLRLAPKHDPTAHPYF
jgi:hypothetical protein